MSNTRIGFSGLGMMGSVKLPDNIIMYCPRCGTEVADKGECLVSFALTLNLNEPPTKKPQSLEKKNVFQVVLEVDCRNCSCANEPPIAEFVLHR